MNAPEADSKPSEQPTPEVGAETPAEKPKRPRAPRKKVAVAAEAEAAGDLAEAPAPAAAAAEVSAEVSTTPAPKRRRTKAAAVAESPTGDQADVSNVSGAESAARPPQQASEPSAAPAARPDDASSDNARRAPDHPGESAVESSQTVGSDVSGADAIAEGSTGPAGEDGEKAGGRRSRNRRRGRRGGDRGREGVDAAGEGGEGSAPGVGDPTGAARPASPQREPRPPREPAPVAEEVFAAVLAGDFDGEASAEGAGQEPDGAADAAAPKRVLMAEPDAPKLHKVLAQAGVGSRRDLEQMIAEGRVTVNAEVAHTGQRISFGDRINVDGKPVRFRIAPPPARVIAYHKPAGEVVTHDDPQQRPTVFRRLPRLAQGKWQSVGRLDLNTEGLLLFTNSGDLANQLMHPRFGVEREYAVRSLGVLDEGAKARLLEGVEIEGQVAAFKSIEDGGGEGVNHWYRVVITEGRNREVRRLFEAVGHAVSRLIRIRYGSVVLPRGLKRGVWVDLDDFDLRNLRRLASGPRAESPSERPPERERPGDPSAKRGRNRRGGKRRGDELERADRAPRADRVEAGPAEPRPPRPPREAREPREGRGPRPPREGRAPRGEPGEGGAIPNPLQQTFDKRAIQQERAQRREMPEDGPIPNPLQQTYDKRALQRDRQVVRDIPEDGPIPNPLQQTYDKRLAQGSPGAGPRGGKGGGKGGPRQGGAGGGANGGRNGRAKKPQGGDPNRVPDPMQTAIGYIGADAFLRKGSGGRGGPRRGGGGGGGGGGRGGPRGGGGGRGPSR